MKTLSLSLLLVLSFAFSFAQTCAVDTANYNMFAPPVDEIPCVERGVPYDLVLQLYAPSNFATVTLDSVRVTNFIGLPTGISTLCTPTGCTFAGNERACINISGTTTDTVGEYPIVYNGFLYTDQGTAPFSYVRNNFPGVLPDYYLTVINPGDACPNSPVSGIGNVKPNRSDVFSIYPNPSTGMFTFSLNTIQKQSGEVNVTDVNGRSIFSQITGTAPVVQLTIDLSKFAKGVYFVQYRSGESIASKKIIAQ